MNPSRTAYELLRRTLGNSSYLEGSPSWCVKGAVDAVALCLDGLGRPDGVEIWLHEGVVRAELPSTLAVAGTGVPLHVHRHRPRPCVQAASAFNFMNDTGIGTIAGLVRDRLHPDRRYALSCGHVLGGSARARVGDEVRLLIAGSEGTAHLVDWTPSFGEDVYRTGVDAAIARVVESPVLSALDAMAKPRGVSSDFRLDAAVTVRASTPKSGLLRSRWSGFVDLDGTEAAADYFLEDAIGYRTDPPTEPGDSGAAVWDHAERLLGVHCAAPVGDERWRSNAVLCPIDRIMDWFDVEPLITCGVPDTLAKHSTSSEPPVAARARTTFAESSHAIDIVAKTLWGEARGEGLPGMRAVACVIGNRAARKWQGKIGHAAVCLAPWQFSCWNENDPNRIQLEQIDRNPDAAFAQAMSVARELVSGRLSDITFGATHYFATTMSRRPSWATNKNPCFQLGRHVFFNDID